MVEQTLEEKLGRPVNAAIIGLGSIGATLSIVTATHWNATQQKGMLYLTNRDHLESKKIRSPSKGLEDMMHCVLAERVQTIDYDKISNILSKGEQSDKADIVFVCVGPSWDRMSDKKEEAYDRIYHNKRNAALVQYVASQLRGFKGLTVYLTALADFSCYTGMLYSGCAAEKIIGMNHVDTMRFRTLIYDVLKKKGIENPKIREYLKAGLRFNPLNLPSWVIGPHHEAWFVPVFPPYVEQMLDALDSSLKSMIETQLREEIAKRHMENFGTTMPEVVLATLEILKAVQDQKTEVEVSTMMSDYTTKSGNIVFAGWPVYFDGLTPIKVGLTLKDDEKSGFERSLKEFIIPHANEIDTEVNPPKNREQIEIAERGIKNYVIGAITSRSVEEFDLEHPDIPRVLLDRSKQEDIRCGMLLNKDTVLVGTSDGLYALNRHSGHADLIVPINNPDGKKKIKSVSALEDKILCSTKSEIYLKEGKRAARVIVDNASNLRTALARIDDKLYIIAAGSINGENGIYVLNTNGQIQEHFDKNIEIEDMVVYGGKLFVTSSNTRVRQIDLRTGKEKFYTPNAEKIEAFHYLFFRRIVGASKSSMCIVDNETQEEKLIQRGKLSFMLAEKEDAIDDFHIETLKGTRSLSVLTTPYLSKCYIFQSEKSVFGRTQEPVVNVIELGAQSPVYTLKNLRESAKAIYVVKND